VGEIGLFAAAFGTLGLRFALVTGDRGACDEVLALAPGVEVAAVKERLTDGTETFLPLAEAGELIARRARVAAGRWGDFVPLTFGQPVRLEVRLARPEMTEFEVPPYMERVDDRTVAAWAPSAHSAVSLYYDGFQPLYMPCVNRLQEQEGPR